MAITASWVRDRDRFPWWVRMREGRYTGLRTFLVNTDLVDLALMAEGLPKYGSAWSSDYPTLAVLEYGDVEVLGGRDTTGEGAAGWCKVPVLYSDPEPGRFVAADPRLAYTEIQASTQQVTVRMPRRRFNSPDGETVGPEVVGPLDQINGGDGAAVLVGELTVAVTTWIHQGQAYDFGRLARLMTPCKVNDAAITLPPFVGTTTRWTLSPGMAMYVGFRNPEVDQGYVKIVHVLQVARDFLVRWQREDARGRALPGIMLDEVYAAADFGGLWPS